MAPFLNGVDLVSDHGCTVFREPLHGRPHRMAFLQQTGSDRVSNGLRRRLVKNPVRHCKAEVLFKLYWIHPALVCQGNILDFSRLRNEIRNFEMADISHGIDPLQLANSELARLRKPTASLAELTDVKEDSIRQSCGPVTKSYMVLAALRKSFLARSVVSSDLGNVGSACVSNASLSLPLVARKALIVFADWRQDSARTSRSGVVDAIVEIDKNDRWKQW